MLIIDTIPHEKFDIVYCNKQYIVATISEVDLISVIRRVSDYLSTKYTNSLKEIDTAAIKAFSHCSIKAGGFFYHNCALSVNWSIALADVYTIIFSEDYDYVAWGGCPQVSYDYMLSYTTYYNKFKVYPSEDIIDDIDEEGFDWLYPVTPYEDPLFYPSEDDSIPTP